MNNYDDLSPAVIRSGLKGRKNPCFFSSMPLNCVAHVTHNTHISCTPFFAQMLRPSGAPRETSWLWPAWRDTGSLQSPPARP